MVRGVAEQQEHANRVAHHDHVPVVLLRNAQLARRHDLTTALSPTASWLGESARSQYALGLTEFVTSVASPITAAQDLGPAPAVVREEDEHHADVVPPHAPRAIPDNREHEGSFASSSRNPGPPVPRVQHHRGILEEVELQLVDVTHRHLDSYVRTSRSSTLHILTTNIHKP